MIKRDKIENLQMQKKATICTGFISFILCCYTLLFTIIAMVWNRLGKNKRTLAIAYGLIIFGCTVYIPLAKYTPADYIRPYLDYNDNILVLDPVRIAIATTYGLWFLYKGHLLKEGIEEWTIDEKKEKLNELIPPGKFNYECRDHMLLFGTTGSGKGITLDHKIKYAFEKMQELVIVCAKLASTDPYSQLKYCRELAKKYGRKLYVVSMDPSVEDRCLYNPFKYVNKTELQNALTSMIESDSHFYHTNFIAWVLSIFKAVRAAGEEVTLSKILDLYEYKNYESYVKRMSAQGKIEDPSKFLKAKIKRYAMTAANDSANLDLIFDAGEEVFDDSWIRDSISIKDALKEHAVIYFDLNGISAKAATSLIGACITSEIQHVAKELNDPSQEKTVICDEASFYISDLFVSCFSLARSAGYKFIVSTQGPTDLKGPQNDGRILSQLINNSNQFGILRINDDEDAEKAAAIIGTVLDTENTRRADGIEYEGTGSIKAVSVMAANPNKIKYLNKRQMIYLEKSDDDDYEPKPVMIRWRTDDL